MAAGTNEPRSVAIIGAGVAGISSALGAPRCSGMCAASSRQGTLHHVAGLQALRALQQVPRIKALEPQFDLAHDALMQVVPSYISVNRQTIVVFERASEIGGVWRENYSGFGAQASTSAALCLFSLSLSLSLSFCLSPSPSLPPSQRPKKGLDLRKLATMIFCGSNIKGFVVRSPRVCNIGGEEGAVLLC